MEYIIFDLYYFLLLLQINEIRIKNYLLKNIIWL